MTFSDIAGLKFLYPDGMSGEEIHKRFVYFLFILIMVSVCSLFGLLYVAIDRLEELRADHEALKTYYFNRRALADKRNAIADSVHAAQVKEWECLIKKQKERGSNESSRSRQGVD